MKAAGILAAATTLVAMSMAAVEVERRLRLIQMEQESESCSMRIALGNSTLPVVPEWRS